MEIFLTILTGVIVFVTGQATLKMVIEPTQKLRETIAETAFMITNNHVVYHNADAIDEEQVHQVFMNSREIGARLVSNLTLVPFYDHIQRVFNLPNKENITKASHRLYGISNHMLSNSPIKYYKLDLYRIEICEYLNIDDPITNGLSKQEILDSIEQLRNNAS